MTLQKQLDLLFGQEGGFTILRDGSMLLAEYSCCTYSYSSYDVYPEEPPFENPGDLDNPGENEGDGTAKKPSKPILV